MFGAEAIKRQSCICFLLKQAEYKTCLKEGQRQQVTNMVTYTSSHLLLPIWNSPLYTVQQTTSSTHIAMRAVFSDFLQVPVYFQTPSIAAVFKVSTKLDLEQKFEWDSSRFASDILGLNIQISLITLMSQGGRARCFQRVGHLISMYFCLKKMSYPLSLSLLIDDKGSLSNQSRVCHLSCRYINQN